MKKVRGYTPVASCINGLAGFCRGLGFFGEIWYDQFMFNKDLIENTETAPVPLAPDPEKDEGRGFELPAGLTLADLQNLNASQIDDKIKAQGAGVGYAGMLKLAAGHGKTPAGAQYQACAFLLNRAGELAENEAADKDLGGRLRALPREDLLNLISVYEKKALQNASDSQKVIEVQAEEVPCS